MQSLLNWATLIGYFVAASAAATFPGWVIGWGTGRADRVPSLPFFAASPARLWGTWLFVCSAAFAALLASAATTPFVALAAVPFAVAGQVSAFYIGATRTAVRRARRRNTAPVPRSMVHPSGRY